MEAIAGIRHHSTAIQVTGAACAIGGLVSKGGLRIALLVVSVALFALSWLAQYLARRQFLIDLEPEDSNGEAVAANPAVEAPPFPRRAPASSAAAAADAPGPSAPAAVPELPPIDPASVLELSIRMLTGKNLEVQANPTDTVLILKRRIEAVNGYTPDRQRLIYSGKELEDGQALDKCGLQSGYIIHFVEKLVRQVR